MSQILIHATGIVLGALVVSLLRLNAKRVVISHAQPVSWVWKAVVLSGKFLFSYGLLVFLSNLAVSGAQAPNAGVGASLLSFGLILWIWGGLIVYFKRS